VPSFQSPTQGHRANQQSHILICFLQSDNTLGGGYLSGESTKPYPYLLSSVVIIRPNPVLRTDITYIRLTKGKVYLCAVLDWFSRYVLAWELSNSLDAFFCLSALEKALCFGKPEIFNSDHGSQETAGVFINRIKQAKISQSWDGRCGVFDNIFTP